MDAGRRIDDMESPMVSSCDGTTTRLALLGRRSRVVLTAAVLAMTATLAVHPGKAAADPVLAVQDVCGAAAPGQARCLSERVVPAQNHAAATEVSPSSTPGGLGPADLIDAYQLDASKGYGQTVAVVDAFDDPNAAADLAVYRSQYGLPPCTVANGCFSKVNQNGISNPLPAANTGWSAEISLDLDMVSAICPQCNILLVEANSAYFTDLGAGVDTAVRLGAKFVSNSYGGGESNAADTDPHYNHPGVAITASSGDGGYGVAYPASSPYVTSVGGTALSRSAGGRGWTETAWSGAGSGCSAYASQPASQLSVSTGCAKRAVADVSAVASPNTGVAVYVTYGGGGWSVYGGTSASSPIIAATYALAGTPGAGDYPNSYPYRNSSSLYDVTSGTNGNCSVHVWCSAAAGWDGPTGLGTPDTAAAFSATGQVSGSPVKFGAIGQLGSPVVAGLSIPILVTPMLPDGDSLAGITWKAARTDCTIAAATSLSTSVSCPASAAGSTSVTATLTDTQGARKVVTLTMNFPATAVKRAVSITANLTGQSGTGQSVCTGTATAEQAVVTDVATGSPVKGLVVTFTKQAGTAAATTSGSGLSLADGSAAGTITATTALTLAAKSGAVGAFSGSVAAPFAVTTGRCVASLSGTMDKSASYYGDPVTVTGTLTRAATASTVPMAGVTVQVLETVAGRTLLLGNAVTAADGSIHAVVHPVSSGTVTLSLPAASGWAASSTGVGALTVLTPTTAVTALTGSTVVGYADAVTMSGTLLRNAGGSVTAMKSSQVSVKEAAATGNHTVSVLATATVAADGSWTAIVHPRTSGELSASFAGAAGLPATTTDIGAIQVSNWTTQLSLSTQLSQQVAASGNKVTGAVTRQLGRTSGPAASVPVGIYLQTTTGSQLLLATATSNAAGVFSTSVAPVENGVLVAKVSSVPGYGDAVSNSVPISIATKVSATAPTVVTGGKAVAITVTLIAPRAGAVNVQSLQAGTWVTLTTVTAPASGRVVASLASLAVGSYTLRASFDGDSRGGAGTSANMVVAVRA
jgi:hypothetical protein